MLQLRLRESAYAYRSGIPEAKLSPEPTQLSLQVSLDTRACGLPRRLAMSGGLACSTIKGSDLRPAFPECEGGRRLNHFRSRAVDCASDGLKGLITFFFSGYPESTALRSRFGLAKPDFRNVLRNSIHPVPL
jgi:hypothetical protein